MPYFPGGVSAVSLFRSVVPRAVFLLMRYQHNSQLTHIPIKISKSEQPVGMCSFLTGTGFPSSSAVGEFFGSQVAFGDP
jgi:hypothetical protein